ncbi:MAG: hypothetical protein K2Q06_14380, partial [Parvularculaceae bacterium]|nr:hypothetical protein [Parvularculaceae bacterium]
MKLRALLILIACAVPVVLMSPSFWPLVNMEFGAQPVGVVHHDGVAQATVLGPRSPWPDWAVTPEVERFRIETYYAPAPGHPALGFATLGSKSSAAAGPSA